ncbi:MAG: hypothetical protein CW691_00620 [Candidatus Bathyarchaeum sp.]|nr:MAG: hypothetical protein CW691_00620 [Candidatus Bathyarchaeum sp.]
MNLHKFTIFKIMAGLALSILIFYSILFGNSVLTIVAFMTLLTTLILLRKKVETVTVDERIHLVSGKAARKTLQIFVLSLVSVGFTILLASYLEYVDLSQLGYTLLYSAALTSLLYTLCWHYYSRKYGG